MFRKMGDGTNLKRKGKTVRTNRVFGMDVGPAVIARTQAVPKDAAMLRPDPPRRMLHLSMDVPILLALVTLLVLGLIALYTASYDYSDNLYNDPYRMISRQLIFLGVGLIAMIGIAFIDYHRYIKLGLYGWLGTLVLLVLVLSLDQATNNSVRGLLGASVQPSEFAKLAIVVYVSVWLYARRERLTNIYLGLIPLSFVLAVTGALIFIQPDISAVVTVFFCGGMIFFLAGGEARQIGGMILAALAIGLVLVKFSDTAGKRSDDFIASWRDPTAVTDHMRGALESFVNGRWTGVGLGNGEIKVLDLPVPPTDSIFAVVGEEAGVVGAIILVVLFTFLLWRGLHLARRAPDQLGALLVGGLSLWLAFEAFVNMGVVLKILPFAGNALPFFSAGGSNLAVSLAAIGIILNVARQSINKESEGGKGALFDLRRGNRRRRIPGPNHLASPKS